MTTYMLDHTICLEGFVADSDYSPPSGAPEKGEYAVSAYDPDIGGSYGAYMYMYECTPDVTMTVSASTIEYESYIIQPARIYTKIS